MINDTTFTDKNKEKSTTAVWNATDHLSGSSDVKQNPIKFYLLKQKRHLWTGIGGAEHTCLLSFTHAVI